MCTVPLATTTRYLQDIAKGPLFKNAYIYTLLSLFTVLLSVLNIFESNAVSATGVHPCEKIFCLSHSLKKGKK